MYEFKIGDTVQTTDGRITYVISEIITDIYGTTWFRKTPTTILRNALIGG